MRTQRRRTIPTPWVLILPIALLTPACIDTLMPAESPPLLTEALTTRTPWGACEMTAPEQPESGFAQYSQVGSRLNSVVLELESEALHDRISRADVLAMFSYIEGRLVEDCTPEDLAAIEQRLAALKAASADRR